MLWILEVACSAHVCGIILGRVQGWNQWCILYYDPIVECHTKEHSMFVATAVSVLVVFYIFSNSSSRFVPHKTVQKVYLMLWI